MKFIHNRKDWKLILEARDNRKKIKKFFDNDAIIEWAHSIDNNYSMWIVNSFKDETIKHLEEIKLIGTEFQGKKVTKQDVLTFMKNGRKSDDNLSIKLNSFLKSEYEQVKNKLAPKYRYVIDWTRGRMRDAGDRVELKGMSLIEAWEKSDEWHKALAEGDHVIHDEEGDIIMTFKDDFYWIDLKTDSCGEEGKAMGHCGTTTYGTTLYSLRRNKKPFVTIAFNEDDRTITQAKGKANDKPIEKYHPYIVDLLINPSAEIEGFDYEYNPQEDFQIGDLNDELFDKLYNGNKKIFEGVEGYTNLLLYKRKLITKEEVAESFKDVFVDEKSGDLYFTVGDWGDTAELVFEDTNSNRTLGFAKEILSSDFDSALYFSHSEKFDFSTHWDYLTVDTLERLKERIIKDQDGSFYDDDGDEREFTFTEENLKVDKWSTVEKLLHPDKPPYRAEEKDVKKLGGMYFYMDEEIFDMSDILEENKDSGFMEEIVDLLNNAANDAHRWSIESKWYEHVTEMVIEHLTDESTKEDPDNRFTFTEEHKLSFKLNLQRVIYLMEVSEEGEARDYDNIEDVFKYSSYDMDENKIIDINDRGHNYGEIEDNIDETVSNTLDY